MLVACSLGHKFALIALNEDQQAQHEEVARTYGLNPNYSPVICFRVAGMV